MRTALLPVLVGIVLAYAPAAASAQPVQAALFDPGYVHFSLSDKLVKEMKAHFVKGLMGPGTVESLDPEKMRQDRLHSMVMWKSAANAKEAREICTELKWPRFVTIQLTGRKDRRVEIVATFVDLAAGDAGVVEERKVVRNHQKALRKAMLRVGKKLATRLKPTAK